LREGLGWKIAGLLFGAVLSVEGLFISIFLGPIQIKGLGEFSRYTVILAGVQLLILGLLILLSWILREKGIRLKGDGILGKRSFDLIMFIAGIVVVAEGFAIVVLAGPGIVSGIGGVMEQTVVLFGAQLFMLGLLALLTWIMRDKKFRSGWTLGYLAGMAMAIEGLISVGVAAPTTIEGMSVISASTVALVGAQLFIIGLLVVLIWMLKDNGVLLKKRLVEKWKLFDYALLITGVVVAIEGLMVIALAGQTVIQDIGVILKYTATLFGLQLFGLGIMAITSLAMGKGKMTGAPDRFKQLAFLCVLFLLLMLPPAYFL